MRIVCLSVALLVLGGCAAQDGAVSGAKAPVTVVADSTTNLTPQTKLHCHKETPPGSNVIQNVCETEKTEAERQALQTKLLDIGSQNGANHHAVGP
ncbi:hypothetical protein [Scleromatobacter humisilvae]|uniref:Secreted protein n=1 Tax=Scleromatobacter humisilvae TaxID=2897159 RepID=A0A9X1YHB2_9BURK|nr:hypothetical protein [Scleromatobacter humisilvae]MCK9686469.1 hypothetical protein [Scleromatobacter humisilvae]